MTLWEAILLGIVQGATEFLPVSSSGHLVMAQEVLDVHLEGVLFEVAVHLATLLSIALVYRERIGALVRGAFARDRDALDYLGLLAVATVPAGLLGVLAKDRIEALFENPYATGVALLVTGALLWSSRAAVERAGDVRPGWRAALLIGVAQAFALVPGISRSGSTVVAALWLGIPAREAAAFSFLMALPAIGGAAVLQIPDLAAATEVPWAALLAGGLAAAVTGVLAIRTFVAMLGRGAFHWFAPYCWIVGLAFLTWMSVGR
jgi:undecaprenyl-diphosphatase